MKGNLICELHAGELRFLLGDYELQPVLRFGARGRDHQGAGEAEIVDPGRQHRLFDLTPEVFHAPMLAPGGAASVRQRTLRTCRQRALSPGYSRLDNPSPGSCWAIPRGRWSERSKQCLHEGLGIRCVSDRILLNYRHDPGWADPVYGTDEPLNRSYRDDEQADLPKVLKQSTEISGRLARGNYGCPRFLRLRPACPRSYSINDEPGCRLVEQSTSRT